MYVWNSFEAKPIKACEFIEVEKVESNPLETWQRPEISSWKNFRVWFDFTTIVCTYLHSFFSAQVWTFIHTHTSAFEQIKKATEWKKRRVYKREKEEVKRISTINTNDLRIKVVFICYVLTKLICVIQAKITQKAHIYSFLAHSCDIFRRQKYYAKIRTSHIHTKLLTLLIFEKNDCVLNSPTY